MCGVYDEEGRDGMGLRSPKTIHPAERGETRRRKKMKLGFVGGGWN
jgi:hypothetical protein